MPAYRGAEAMTPVFALKAVCLMPGNPARGLDAHQGIVTLFDGETGRADGGPQRLGGDRDPHRGGHGRGDARARRARTSTRARRSSAPGVQARAHLRRAAARARLRRGRAFYAPTAAHAQALVDAAAAADCRADVAPSAARGGRGRRRRRHRDQLARAGARARAGSRPGAHVNAVGASSPTAREIDAATVAAAALFCDSRESVRNEAGEFLLAVDEGLIDGEEHIRAELGEVLAGMPARPQRRRRADAVPLARDRASRISPPPSSRSARRAPAGLGTEVEL